MRNLLTRSLTGAIFVSLLLGSILWNELAATCVLGVFFVLGVIEFYSLFDSHEHIRLKKWINISSAFLVFALLLLALNKLIPEIFALTTVPLVFLMNTTELWRKQKNPIQNMAVGTFGLIYLVAPFFLMIYIHHIDQYVISAMAGKPYFPILAGFFVLVWTNDTFAYLTGMLMGKRKLFERISPKKTWEGTIGGIVLCMITISLLSLLINSYSIKDWMFIAGIAAITGTFGDLLESKLKRMAGVKDSGQIMPGHGGFLDRFDSLLLATPFVWLYVQFFMH